MVGEVWVHCLFLLLSCWAVSSSPRRAVLTHTPSERLNAYRRSLCLWCSLFPLSLPSSLCISLSLSANIWSRLVVVLLDHQKPPQGAHMHQLQLDSCPVSISSSPLALKQGGKCISDLVKINDDELWKLNWLVFVWAWKAQGKVQFL